MAMLETLVQLFAAFAKIGFTSFGGTSMIPLIMDEMSSHGWMTDADLTNLIAIAEMTPGSLGVNAATFAGTKTAGMPGGVFAVLGVLSPTLTLTLLAAAFFQKFRTSKVMSYIMKIVKPVCIGMVLGVPVFAMFYSVVSRLVRCGLKKRGLPLETEQYLGRTGPLAGTGPGVEDSGTR